MAAPTLGGPWRAELSWLVEGWDNDDGKPITSAAIHTIESFATVPVSDGGIQLEIHRDGFDIEICIGADGRIKSVSLGCENTHREAEG